MIYEAPVPDLRTLAIFVKVAEKRSFVRAATDLGITQSGVSNAIKRLENQLGTPLLVRTTRRVGLTEDGAAFFERCRQALAAIDEAEHVLKRAQLKPSGTLRIDVPLAFGRIKLVPLLRGFQLDYPDVRLRITFTDRYIDLIEEGVDVAVRFGALQDSSLIARRLTTTQFNAAASPAYLKKYGRPKTPDDLEKHNCLSFAWRDTRQTRDWRFTVGGSEVRVTPIGTMTFTEGAALCQAAIDGCGIAQLHNYYLDTAFARGMLVPLLEDFKPKADPISLVYPQTRHLTPNVRAFVDFMVERFKSERQTAV
jgi:LysR family transcriptional regulator, regulator for bpeEF and oprC